MNTLTTYKTLKSQAVRQPKAIKHDLLFQALYNDVMDEKTCDNLMQKLNKIYGAYSD